MRAVSVLTAIAVVVLSSSVFAQDSQRYSRESFL